MRHFTLISSLVAAGILGAAATSQPVTPQIMVETAPPAVDPNAEMICRRIKDTGSLVKSKKTCHTRSQWSFIADENRRLGRQLVQDGATRPSGN